MASTIGDRAHDPLFIYVKLDWDVYLKLDYVQADDTMVHPSPMDTEDKQELKLGEPIPLEMHPVLNNLPFMLQ